MSARVGNSFITEFFQTTLTLDTAAIQQQTAAQVRALLTPRSHGAARRITPRRAALR